MAEEEESLHEELSKGLLLLLLLVIDEFESGSPSAGGASKGFL